MEWFKNFLGLRAGREENRAPKLQLLFVTFAAFARDKLLLSGFGL